MRRHVILLFILLLGATALASAQEEEPGAVQPPDAVPVQVPRDSGRNPFGPITGVWSVVEVEAQQVQEPTMVETHGADLCENAPNLPLEDYGTAGDEITVNSMTESPSDPPLTCMWGNPSRVQGYRTVWYRFVAPVSGHLKVQTGFNPSNIVDSYDTVLALYRSGDGTCGALSQLACDDDTEGFLSSLEHFVIEGRTYYIEVADRQLSSQGADTLRLAVALEEGESFWQQQDELWENPRSRHMVVTDGRYAYVLGGETVVSPFAERRQQLWRFDPMSGEWTELWPLEEQWDAYSRTSAAYYNGHIYAPSGNVGSTSDNEIYEGDHWVYSIADNRWYAGTPVPWDTMSPTGEPYAWHQAVTSPADGGFFLTGGLVSGNSNPVPGFERELSGRMLLYRPDESGITGTWQQRADMANPRYAHVAGLLNTPQGRRICVVSGLGQNPNLDDQLVVLATGECYNPASNSWSSLPPLNFARFSAGSAVGPDGRWYVFGGLNARFDHVPHTEVYDPVSNSWEVLDSRYSLREPGRSWPGGVFLGSTLWVFGGELLQDSDIRVVPVVQRLIIPTRSTWLAAILGGPKTTIEPNNTLEEAVPVALNQEVWNNYSENDDFFDFYRFRVTDNARYQAEVTNIPAESNYDVFIYNSDKQLVGDSQNVGTLNELAVTHPLTPGFYYVMVLRSFGQPTDEPYRLMISRH
ncbi:MAG: Kelch repeat-containing protein, partial [Chloroflexota bacterium]